MEIVTVVIPCLNEETHIGALLAALAGQDAPGIEIVIADGGSRDRTPDIIREMAETHPNMNVRLVRNRKGTIPAGLNLAIRESKGDIIVRMDAHSLPPPDYVGRCRSLLRETGAGVVGGAWNIRAGGPGAMARAIAIATGSRLGAGDALYRLKSSAESKATDTVPFGCFRRDTWQRVGGYNEDLLSNEDYEFNYKVRKGGGSVRFDPRLRCDYFARATLAALAAQYWRYGVWKARMLKLHPRSIRIRQAVPAAWTMAALGLPCLGLCWRPGGVAGGIAWGIYVSTVLGGCISLTGRNGWTLYPRIFAALVTLHFAWGAGFWRGFFGGTHERAERG